MAKELPYFKFEPNQWENGNIQIMSREIKGLFIDLCSMYWSRLGDVPLKLAIQKLCDGNANAFNSLCDENIIEVIDGNIYIKFLSEQLNEFEIKSEKNSKIAKDGWQKRRKQKELSELNANASNSQSERNAIREDKIRVDESKKDKFNFKQSLLEIGADNNLVDDWLVVRKNKKASNTKTAFELFVSRIEGMDVNEVLKICVERSWSGFNKEWLKNIESSDKKEYTLHSQLGSQKFMLTEKELQEKIKTGYWKC